MNTKDIVIEERFFCLFKGDPGSGKSIAAGSFPNPYFIDNDGRLKSVVNYWRPRGREFEFDRFETPLTCNRRLEELYLSCPFRTIVYDGLTTGCRQIFAVAKSLRGYGEDGNKKDSKRRMVAGTELTQIEDYDAETTWMEVIINNLKAISFKHNVNVIVTAHVLTIESAPDLKTHQTTISRNLLTKGRKAAALIPVDFDEAYHFDVQTSFESSSPKYTIVTQHTGWDWAKTALPIPMRIDFTNLSLYDEIMREIAKSKVAQEFMTEMK